jgi:2-oxoglutarate ferredoxin oxidoreductase subunit delta
MSPEFNVKGYHFPALSDGRDCTGCDLCGMYCPDYAIHGARVPAQPAGEQPGK